jgi:hypothetical protein
MGAAIEAVQRIGLKLFADGSTVQMREFVPSSTAGSRPRRWRITLLIDVADYAHVPDGPGVMLVAHEGTQPRPRRGTTRSGVQPQAARRRGHRRALAGDPRTALEACRRLEDEPVLKGRLAFFSGDEIELFANDRLQAPTTPRRAARSGPPIAELVRSLYGEMPCTTKWEPDARERFSLRLQAAQPLSARELLARLR